MLGPGRNWISTMERRLAAIMAADIVGYAGLMGEDEEGTLARLIEWRENIVAPAVRKHKGRIFKSMGDGLLAEFGSAVDAVRCGVEIQTLMNECDDEATDRLRIRIGINLGDVIVE
jgi:class 3 adenylate cyclase